MAKPISDETKASFLDFCRKCLEDEELQGSFGFYDFDEFLDITDDGDPLWEYHAANYDPESSHNIFELLGSVQEHGLAVEQHGYDDFCVVPFDQEA